MIPLPEAAKSLGTALAIGILIGMERERRKGQGTGRNSAGLRTFTLVALAGAIGQLANETVLLALIGLLVVGGTLLSYFRTSRTDPGLTTEVALGVTFLLGTLTIERPALAAALGVSVALILVSRSRVHRFVNEVLTAQELEDLLIFAAAAVVVLPLVPNGPVGPYGLINLFTTWRLVVIMMGISGFGYITLRAIGARYGLALSGLFSGFISSSATIASMGARAKADASISAAAVSGAAFSSVATVIQMIVIVGAINPSVLRILAIPMLAAGGVAVVAGAVSARRVGDAKTQDRFAARRAFDLRTAALLALTVSTIMAGSSLLLRWLGNNGLLLAISLAGFADTHSAAISAANLATSGTISPRTVTLAILGGFTTNTLTKCILAFTSGPASFARFVTFSVLLMAGAAWTAFLLI